MRRAVAQVVSLGVILVTLCWHVAAAGEVRLRNVCCEPLQELYQDYDDAFARYWKGKTGQEVSVIISPGPSGKQAQAVIKGMEADVAALASESDIDAIAGQAHLLPVDWRKQLPNGSSPY